MRVWEKQCQDSTGTSQVGTCDCCDYSVEDTALHSDIPLCIHERLLRKSFSNVRFETLFSNDNFRLRIFLFATIALINR